MQEFMISTGLRKALLETSPFITAMTGRIFKCYSGVVPATADAAIDTTPVTGNILLGTISVDGLGTGVTFEAASVNGMAVKATAEAWEFVITATGTPTFYRHCLSTDANALSPTLLRTQGTIGTSLADLIVNTTAWTTSMTTLPPISAYAVGLPLA